MKKIILSFIILIGLILPIKIKAVEITGTSITASQYATVGNEYNLSVSINFSGLESDDNLGIFSVIYELIFDPTIFEVVSVSGSNYDSIYVTAEELKEEMEEAGENADDILNGGVISIVNSKDPHKKCSDNTYVCSDYSATIKFRVLNTNAEGTNISLGETGAILYKIGEVPTEESGELTYTVSGAIQYLNIINPYKTEQPVKTPPTPKPVETPKTEEPKDSNIFLKSLEIKNHEIVFDKNTRDYTIELEKDENKLEITALSESDKSSVKITGADDLKAHNYKVEIEVKAEDGSFKTYYINAIEKNEKKEVIKEEKKEEHNVTKKIAIILISSISGLAVVGLLIVLRTHIKNKKLNKLLKELDK